jgi:polyisoprenoid-binding protein YceI
VNARRPILAAALSILGLASLAQATIRGTYRPKFDAESTLHGFSGSAPPAAFSVEDTPARMEGREPWNLRLTVDVAAISTELGMRDTKMRDMFEADRHPKIIATIGTVDVARLRTESDRAIEFDLAIRDVVRHVQGRVTHWSVTGDAATFDVEFDVSLADFGLEPPQALFMKVDDRVHVSVAVEARLEPRPTVP